MQPLRESEPTTEAPSLLTGVPARPLAVTRVLVADDDEAVRTVLSHVLSDEGIDVVGLACDGREAVALALELKPDTVLLDIRMPELGGIEAAQQIRAALPDMRLVMLSAYDDATLQQEAKVAGASRFLVKGCALSDLIDAVVGP
jgi:DNA-binding NarL/FixJ family response regulator